MNKTEELLREISKEIAEAMKSQISSNGSIHTGNLANNIVNDSDENSISITIPLYGKFVDEGTKPHMPPVDKIRNWADSKGLNAWGVAINISKFGTKAHPFIFKFNTITQNRRKDILETVGIDLNFNILKALQQWQSQ